MLELRSRLLGALRAFFAARGFVEIDPPVLVRAPAPEPHIDAVPVRGGWLRTSPELHMKRLLARGLPRIYSIGPCFRAGERTARHREEFCLLEWYRADADYRDLMLDVELLLRQAAQAAIGGEVFRYQGRGVDLGIVERRTVREALATEAGIADPDSLDDDRWSVAIGTQVEPKLGRGRLTILADYPISQGGLARRHPDDPHTVERFEAYVEGIELANGWSELTDPAEQRARFERDRARRAVMGKDDYPLDEEFLTELSKVGRAAGIALGVDRLVMLLADRAEMGDVLAFDERD
ncbi:MAG: EF-P lysine aminoacylase GenX [Deltaproteobacteria bacterium]|nr:EF-P lysine aminoacylase GenX [Deltaproteobacteria bacterium]